MTWRACSGIGSSVSLASARGRKQVLASAPQLVHLLLGTWQKVDAHRFALHHISSQTESCRRKRSTPTCSCALPTSGARLFRSARRLLA